MAFVHYTVKKIVHGLGAIKEAANEVKNLKGSKAFIVTDPGLAKIGVQKPLEEALTAGGIEWKLYAEAQLEPSMDSIQHCTDEAKAFGADVIIGFGGGLILSLRLCRLKLSLNQDSGLENRVFIKEEAYRLFFDAQNYYFV